MGDKDINIEVDNRGWHATAFIVNTEVRVDIPRSVTAKQALEVLEVVIDQLADDELHELTEHELLPTENRNAEEELARIAAKFQDAA